jgi:uncharacterized protein (DUF433 family)
MLKVDSYVPLTENEHGVLRIGGTRVSLDSVVSAFEHGETPEQVVQNFPVLKPDDVYAVITYYLRNQDEVRAYLKKQAQEAEVLRSETQREFPTHGLRERVRRRQRERPTQSDT